MKTKLDHRPRHGYGVEAGGVGLVVVPKKERGQLAETIRVRVDDSLVRRLDAVAAETGRSRSDVVRLLMVAGLELHEAEKKAGKR